MPGYLRFTCLHACELFHSGPRKDCIGLQHLPACMPALEPVVALQLLLLGEKKKDLTSSTSCVQHDCLCSVVLSHKSVAFCVMML